MELPTRDLQRQADGLSPRQVPLDLHQLVLGGRFCPEVVDVLHFALPKTSVSCEKGQSQAAATVSRWGEGGGATEAGYSHAFGLFAVAWLVEVVGLVCILQTPLTRGVV